MIKSCIKKANHLSLSHTLVGHLPHVNLYLNKQMFSVPASFLFRDRLLLFSFFFFQRKLNQNNLRRKTQILKHSPAILSLIMRRPAILWRNKERNLPRIFQNCGHSAPIFGGVWLRHGELKKTNSWECCLLGVYLGFGSHTLQSGAFYGFYLDYFCEYKSFFFFKSPEMFLYQHTIRAYWTNYTIERTFVYRLTIWLSYKLEPMRISNVFFLRKFFLQGFLPEYTLSN